MALKTFNVDDVVYKEFSKHCKKEGISMSKKVEKFIAEEVSRIKGLGKGIKEEIKKVESEDEHSMGRYC